MMNYLMEKHTDRGTVLFSSEQYGIKEGEYSGTICHFLNESEWRRVVDVWGKVGWMVGYRDFVPSLFRKGQGIGGELYIFYDIDKSVASVHPSVVEYV